MIRQYSRERARQYIISTFPFGDDPSVSFALYNRQLVRKWDPGIRFIGRTTRTPVTQLFPKDRWEPCADDDLRLYTKRTSQQPKMLEAQDSVSRFLSWRVVMMESDIFVRMRFYGKRIFEYRRLNPRRCAFTAKPVGLSS